MLESVQQQDINMQSLQDESEYDQDYVTMIADINPMTLMSQIDEVTMYFDQAMNEPDSQQFLQTAVDEISTHQKNHHWVLVPIADLPLGTKIMDCVWSMKRKRRLLTNQIYKHKARLNLHGGQQELGLDYWETHAPVVTWAAIRLFLKISYWLIHKQKWSVICT